MDLLLAFLEPLGDAVGELLLELVAYLLVRAGRLIYEASTIFLKSPAHLFA